MLSNKGLVEMAKKLTKISNLSRLWLEFDYSSLINSYHRLPVIGDKALLKLGKEISKMESLSGIDFHFNK